MQEGTLTLLVDMAARGAAAATLPPRSAEEIAREMVPDAGWLQLGTDGVRLASDVSVPHARSIVARTIIQARSDGAAAALAGQQPRTLATIEGIDHYREGLHRIWQGEADPREIAACYLGEDPMSRDLAGRIRALIQEYAGRWTDAEPRSIERRAATGVMDDLCRALDDVRTGTGRPLTWWIELFRHPSGSMDPTIRAHRSRAADELEAIVRECAPSEGT